MYMPAILELTDEKYQYYTDLWDNLVMVLGTYDITQLFDDYQKQFGYASYTFSGKVTDQLIDKLGRQPKEEELVMLVDRGFSHFGAQITYQPQSRVFRGKVNID